MATITYEAQQYASSNTAISLAQITAASGGSDIIHMVGNNGKTIYRSALFQILVASINTDVVVRIQGSLDGDNWFNVDEDELDTTYTANGTYALRYAGEGEVIYLRLYKVSESGGTDVTLDIKVKVFDPVEGDVTH